MVYLEYVKEADDEVVYDYMPEREDAPRGTVSVNRKTRKRSLLKKSSENELSWYRGHAWRRIEQMLDDGRLENRTCSAWY